MKIEVSVASRAESRFQRFSLRRRKERREESCAAPMKPPTRTVRSVPSLLTFVYPRDAHSDCKTVLRF